MSTRSLTHIHEDGKILLTFYRHSDGYPEGHGAALAEFLDGFRIVNGLQGERQKIANGMNCLAAFIIAHFKDRPGQIYIYPTDSTDVGEEYVYQVKLGKAVEIPNGRFPQEANEVEMSCAEAGGKELYSGAPAGFKDYLKTLAEETT